MEIFNNAFIQIGDTFTKASEIVVNFGKACERIRKYQQIQRKHPKSKKWARRRYGVGQTCWSLKRHCRNVRMSFTVAGAI